MSRLLSVLERRAVLGDYGDTVTVDGIPIAAQLNKEFTEPGDISSYTPVITVTDEDLSLLDVGSTVIVNDVAHTVETYQREGSGYTVVVLSEDG